MSNRNELFSEKKIKLKIVPYPDQKTRKRGQDKLEDLILTRMSEDKYKQESSRIPLKFQLNGIRFN